MPNKVDPNFPVITHVSTSKCFGGYQKVYKQMSKELLCEMKFAIFLPSTAQKENVKLPVVYWLSGLTCTEQNMITKSGFQKYAEEYQLVVVCPDTSPRGCNIQGEEEHWDLGTGASFYVDATQEHWSKYKMYSYVTKELRMTVEKNFPCIDPGRSGITGHSMGGHGALVCFFRNPQAYRAVTAFAPISNPINSPWGKKAFSAYLGSDKESWKNYDATELVKIQPQKSVTIIVEQGTSDEWMRFLNPNNFIEACKSVGQPVIFNEREGYDHGYYFVSTFIQDHLKHFATVLRQ